MRKVLLISEYSGGHFFPAYTLACYLSKKTSVYLFVPSLFLKNMFFTEEFKIIGKQKEKREKGELFYRFLEALRIILKIKPDAVIGFGGRVSFPFILLSSLFGLRTAIYEPNTRWGKANYILRILAKRIYTGFDTISLSKAKRVGIPLRISLKKYNSEEAKKSLGIDPSLICVLCLGGSQGSSFLNQLFKRLIEERKQKFGIIHLTGLKDFYFFQNFYGKIIKKDFFVKDFFKDMGLIYSAADIAITRAGALTIAELAYFRIPAILIPYPKAGKHQLRNAQYLVEKKAGFLVEQNKCTFSQVKKIFYQLLTDEDLRRKISDNLAGIKIYEKGDIFSDNIFKDISSW